MDNGPIRLLVCDIDGTLVRHDKGLPEENVRAIRAAVQGGLKVSLISARPAAGMLPIAAELGLDGPFGAFNGGTIFTASGGEFIAYTFTYMMVNFMMQNYLYGRYRWPWISDLYEYIQTIYLLPAVLSVIANPKKPTFKVTSKGESMHESRVSELGMPYFIIFGILLLGVVATGVRVWLEPYKADLTLVTGAWNVLNLIIAGCALGVVLANQHDRALEK